MRGQTEFVFQLGANAGQTATVHIRGSIAEALRAIDGAIGEVSDNRAGLGAFQNRMESTIRSLSVSVENLSAAHSCIRDAGMA